MQVAAWIIFWCLVGREFHGSHFEDSKAAFMKGAGKAPAGESFESPHTSFA
jgi:hypothetical protein